VRGAPGAAIRPLGSLHRVARGLNGPGARSRGLSPIALDAAAGALYLAADATYTDEAELFVDGGLIDLRSGRGGAEDPFDIGSKRRAA
jgi:hypothetical protein